MKKYSQIWITLVAVLLLTFTCKKKEDTPQTTSTNTTPTTTTPVQEIPPKYSSENAFPNLTFDSPVEFTHAGDGTNRLFVIEQAGIIKIFDNNSASNRTSNFLDIVKKVDAGGELGLLGLAFHPNFKNNGYFYVNYTRNSPRLQTVVSRFEVKSNPNQADSNTEVILFTFDQPYSNHNGGKLAFGVDGYLYISTGDGGSGGDPQNNAQNRKSLLGKMLRIDVNATDKGNYGIPKDNPYIGNNDGFREEIYAFGLRNPWRFSFDSVTNNLWAGDVGQNAVEEIDIITKGGNYGWSIKEANNCYKSDQDCNRTDLIAPIWSYKQGSDGRSVTGGYVYRGKKLKSLIGKYIYADYVSGRLWAISFDGSKASSNDLIINQLGAISAFGEDANQELYACDYANGKILKILEK